MQKQIREIIDKHIGRTYEAKQKCAEEILILFEGGESKNLVKSDFIGSLSDDQIGMIANMFANREQMLIDDSLGDEWILNHAFQIGAKFYRDFIKRA